MSEKNTPPKNPSEVFAAASKEKHPGTYDVLESKVAAEAAKPWMDVAVGLHDEKNKMEDEAWVYENATEAQSLGYLTDYAERRAHLAVNGERDASLTSVEEEMLDAYTAELAMIEAQVKLDDLTPEHIESAWSLAKDRAEEAHRAGNRQELARWNGIAARAEEYGRLISGESLDDQERGELERKLLPEAGVAAGFALSRLETDGTIAADDSVTRDYFNKAKVDAKNMRVTTELYGLFAEVQAQSPTEPEVASRAPQPEIENMLKRQYELVAKQEAEYASLVDPEVLEDADFRDASTKIREAMKEARINNDDKALKRWQQLNRGMNEYESAWHEDDQDTLPDDIYALQRRRDFMEFLASVSPRHEMNEANEAERKETNETEDKYNPEDTDLPLEDPNNPAFPAALRRSQFIKNYLKDPEHMKITPENVKIMQDYMVLQTRSELKDIPAGRRTSGGIELVFRVTAGAMSDFERGLHDQKFIWQLVAHNLKQPDMTYGQFKAMSLKDVVAAMGIDITAYVEDYDKKVSFEPREVIEIPAEASFKNAT